MVENVERMEKSAKLAVKPAAWRVQLAAKLEAATCSQFNVLNRIFGHWFCDEKL